MGWGISRDRTGKNHISLLILGLLITILLPDVFHFGASATSPHHGESLGSKIVGPWFNDNGAYRVTMVVRD